tara:strand:+ start:826 stop:1269 length:444 start_codon:yes stop_codon:yes gene_type:complete
MNKNNKGITIFLFVVVLCFYPESLFAQSQPFNSLRGNVSGLSITNINSTSGAPSNINIRGMSSLVLSNQPLIIVDGVEFNSSTSNESGNYWDGITSTSRLLDIDPNTILKIEVLKSLNQTVIYGNRGRNGVILVTTKNGVKSSSRKP